MAPTLDKTGEVSETIVRKLAVNAMLLKILNSRNMAAFGDGSSNTSRPVKCNIGSGIHIKHKVKRPIPVVHAFENMMER
jgi:hypothetical protein